MVNNCPKCGSNDLKVTDSRPKESYIWRIRQCKRCSHRFKTFEVSEAEWDRKETLEAEFVKKFTDYFARLSANEQVKLLNKLAG